MERTRQWGSSSQKEKEIFLSAAEQWRSYHRCAEEDRLSPREWQEAMEQGLESEGIAPGQSDRLNVLAELEAQTWDW